jgi:hypothetical protein
MNKTHLAFSLPRRAVRGGILIPKYYDPDLEEAHRLASTDFNLPSLGEVLEPGEQGSRLGDWVRRDFYGSGDIPFVRTSDLSHWRIRPDHKKAVSDDVYESYRERQSVQADDLLFVAHGTYLVGECAIVTGGEERLVVQDHVFRLRVDRRSGLSPYFVLAALSTSYCRRQIRARQFSADIIDKIGNRHLELRLPVPKDGQLLATVSEQVRSIVLEQSRIRAKLREVTESERRMSRERSDSRLGFGVKRSALRNGVLIPKYYDPSIDAALHSIERADSAPWVSIGDLVASGQILLSSGVEVGKMAYGTGSVPFLRTSDIADLEVKRDSRHSISIGIYERFAKKAALARDDILLVRDGTYLVGSSAIVTDADLPALFCGGMFRLRVGPNGRFSPAGLLAALNLPIVRRQMRARQFTRDVIDTLGSRLLEVRIPAPGTETWSRRGDRLAALIRDKEDVKSRIRKVIASIEPQAPAVLAGRPSWSMR